MRIQNSENKEFLFEIDGQLITLAPYEVIDLSFDKPVVSTRILKPNSHYKQKIPTDIDIELTNNKIVLDGSTSYTVDCNKIERYEPTIQHVNVDRTKMNFIYISAAVIGVLLAMIIFFWFFGRRPRW